MRHILGVSGKDSAASAILTKLNNPHWDSVELFFNDTRCDYPCVIEWLDKIELFLGKKILRIDGDLPGAIARRVTSDRAFLPSRNARYCTKEAKIQPMEKWIGDSVAVLYTGLRADERDRAGYTPSNKVSVQHPLIDAGINLGGVYAILEGVDLLPPDFFWQSLYDKVCVKWSDRPNVWRIAEFDSFLSIHQKRILFSGRTRANCYFCFNQRLYEFVWLSETYPELFEQACAYEKDDYTWIRGESLRSLVSPKRKAKIIDNQASKVLAQVESIVFGATLKMDTEVYDTPSCGLFCGK